VNQPDLADQLNGDPDPFFTRYRAALVRSWVPVLAVALATGLLLALLVGGGQATVSAEIDPDRSVDGVLASADLVDAVEDVPRASEMRSAVRAFDEPDGVDILVDGTDSVSVVISAPDETSASVALDELVAMLDQFVADRRATAATALARAVDADRERLEERLAEIDRDLVESDGPIRDIYLFERNGLSDDLAATQSTLIGLETWQDSEARLVVARDTATTGNSRLMWGVVGFVLGGLAAVTAVLVRAHFDRRVWTRSDARALGIAAVPPVLPTDGASRALQLAALSAVAGRDGAPALVLAVDDAGTDVAAQVAGALGTERARAASLREVTSVDVGEPVVLVAAVGATEQSDLVRAAELMTELGAPVVALVLGGVTERAARRADG